MQTNRNTKEVQPQQATKKVGIIGGKSNVISNKMLVEHSKQIQNMNQK